VILWIIWKDLLVSFKDKKSLVITILMPAILTAILGFAFSGMMGGNKTLGRAEVAVVNMGDWQEDIKEFEGFLNSPIGRQIEESQKEKIIESIYEFNFEDILYREVLSNTEVSKFLNYRKMPLKEAEEALKEGEITAMIVIPEGFLYKTLINLLMPFRTPVEIEVIKHPDHLLKGDMVEGILKGFTDALSAGIIAKNTFLEIAIENNIGDKAYGELDNIINGMYRTGIRDINLNKVTEEGKKTISSFQYYAVGMAVMFILYAAADGAHYTIDELKNGTYNRMILANTGICRIMASRFISTSIFSAVQITVLMLFSRFAFNTHWGDFTGILVLTLFLALAVGSLSVFLSSINLRLKDNRASIVFQAGFIQFSALIGGSFFPMDAVPLLKKMGTFTVNGAAMQGFLKLMRGYHIWEITGILLILTAVTGISLAAGAVITAGIKE
jgi:ABC-2 type transport system permease protein